MPFYVNKPRTALILDRQTGKNAYRAAARRPYDRLTTILLYIFTTSVDSLKPTMFDLDKSPLVCTRCMPLTTSG